MTKGYKEIINNKIKKIIILFISRTRKGAEEGNKEKEDDDSGVFFRRRRGASGHNIRGRVHPRGRRTVQRCQRSGAKGHGDSRRESEVTKKAERDN